VSLAFWLTMGLLGFAALPAAWGIGREAIGRVRTRRALAQVAKARNLIEVAGDGGVAALTRSLRERFDPRTIERVVVALLQSADEPSRVWGARLFGELRLLDDWTSRLRGARRWSDRQQAAEILGLAGQSAAVPALVEALRERHEDETSVKSAAASALAKLRDGTAIPLLVSELAGVEDQSSRNVAEAIAGFGAMAIPALLELLVDPKRHAARVWAARILGRVGDASCVEELVGRLHDRDDRLRMAAAEALGAIGNPRALQAVIRAALRDPAPQVRAHAAGAVARIEGERAIDVLVAALADPDYGTRLRALEAFETMRIEDTSPLEAALRDPNAEVRRRAALALERVGYLDKIVVQLTAEDRATRTRAYAALVMLGEVGLVDSVASYLHHASFEVRALAAKACGELGAPHLGGMLLRVVEDDAWPVRAAVCEALGRLTPGDAPPALIKALGDAEESVRDAAAEALTSYAPELLAEHVTAFVAQYELSSAVVRRSLVVTVGRIQDPVADALIVRASSDPSDAVRLQAVAALAARPDDIKVEPLVSRLTDASIEVRMAAATALGSVVGPDAFEGLVGALSGAQRDVREQITAALASGTRDVLIARLPELEASESLDVHLGVAWTLGKIGDPEGVPTLARFLVVHDATLRASAAGALGKIAHPSSREALLAAAADPDGRVRAAVVNALARIGDGDERTLRTLELRARDPDVFVRNRALIGLASSGGAAAEGRVRDLAGSAARSARTVALAFIGTETAMTSVFEELAQPEAFEVLIAFLDREDARVRAAFFDALHLPDPAQTEEPPTDASRVVSQYEKALRTSLDVDARRLAVQGLASLGLERAVPVLCDAATGDPHESIRLRATRALATTASDADARRALIRVVADPSPDVAIAAVHALASQHDPAVTTALERRLGAGGDELREVVERTLADLHRDHPMAFIDWMMGVDVPDLLAPAVRVLARMAKPEMLPLFQELLRSRSTLVRAETVRALVQLPFPDVAELLEERTHDPSEEVRLAVVEAVGAIPEAVGHLASLRRDPSTRVRTASATALERVDGAAARAAHRALDHMLDDSSATVRAAALTSLAGSRDAEGLRAFGRAWLRVALDARLELRREPRGPAISDRIAMRLSSSAEPDERRCAVIAIGAFGVPGFATWLVPALRDPSPAVRIATLHALASVQDPVVRRAIGEMLSDPDGEVQDAVRRTLVRSVG
jgi:HEAT repeat protein